MTAQELIEKLKNLSPNTIVLNTDCLEYQTQMFESKPSIDFADFWELFNNKIGKSKVMAKWNKLKVKDQIAIMNTLPNYLRYIEVKKISQMNPETYLNGRRWEDELNLEQYAEQIKQIEKNAENYYFIYKNESLELRREKVRKFCNEKVNKGERKSVTDGFIKSLVDKKSGERISQLGMFIGLEKEFERYLYLLNKVD